MIAPALFNRALRSTVLLSRLVVSSVPLDSISADITDCPVVRNNTHASSWSRLHRSLWTILSAFRLQEIISFISDVFDVLCCKKNPDCKYCNRGCNNKSKQTVRTTVILYERNQEYSASPSRARHSPVVSSPAFCALSRKLSM